MKYPALVLSTFLISINRNIYFFIYRSNIVPNRFYPVLPGVNFSHGYFEYGQGKGTLFLKFKAEAA